PVGCAVDHADHVRVGPRALDDAAGRLPVGEVAVAVAVEVADHGAQRLGDVGVLAGEAVGAAGEEQAGAPALLHRPDGDEVVGPVPGDVAGGQREDVPGAVAQVDRAGPGGFAAPGERAAQQ